MTQQERAKQLATDHWGYVKPTIEAHAMLDRPDTSLDLPMYSWDEMIAISAYHYRTAAIHFYGHGVEDERNGMFKTLQCSACDICGGKKCPKHPAYVGCAVDTPTAKDTTTASLCHTCQRNAPLKCHGEYLMTKDGGCEGFMMQEGSGERTPSLCHSCHQKICSPELIHDCEVSGTCTRWLGFDPEPQQDTPTAAERPAPHTDPAVNCGDCSNAGCELLGSHVTQYSCASFKGKEAQP